ncbi:GPW/gp25 family protein [Asticcacaulis sp. MM231]|uniref:GPW/gp25 family protein n=1 Tax=Asticcacaulis sp. MM231 TaxID=3157666 RepID=UPI0032D5A3A0
MNRTTGKPIDGLAFILQSIKDILTTPVGSRTFRRDYGSYLHRVIDMAATAATRLLASAYCASAIARWEKRVKLTRVKVTLPDATGAGSVYIEGHRIDLPVPEEFSASIQL